MDATHRLKLSQEKNQEPWTNFEEYQLAQDGDVIITIEIWYGPHQQQLPFAPIKHQTQ
jgi:hypothetical protein